MRASFMRRVGEFLNRRYHELVVFRSKDPSDVFASIWRHNYWGGNESRSGPGSSIAQTESLRLALPKMVASHKVTSILDAPCGDLNWMRLVFPQLGIPYIGGDIVKEIVEGNRRSYASDVRTFEVIDVTKDDLPAVDLWMCRALFFHLSNRDIGRALKNFLRSEIQWIFMTNCLTDASHVNRDITTGDYRTLNLRLAPFELPPPREEIPDCIPPAPEMSMALWHRDDLELALPRIEELLTA